MEDKASSHPGQSVVDAVERTLQLARTWLGWDGRPRVADDGARVYTPHKAMRRMADHLIDHIAEIGALLAGVPPIPDHWHASSTTLGGDWAWFTEVDLNEAEQRLRRLASIISLQLLAAGPAEWDTPRGENQTLRQIADHAGSAWYAEQVGDLSKPAPPPVTASPFDRSCRVSAPSPFESMPKPQWLPTSQARHVHAIPRVRSESF